MLSNHLMDLDELLLLCRDSDAKQYMIEAVNCYKVGAYRACIITTWIAVLYDFVNKIRVLVEQGDKNAETKLNTFEDARKNIDYHKSLRFEDSILEWAKDEFEFITQIQKENLERLEKDRNRCAHPSMMSEYQPFMPSAEVARSHMRNAVDYLLQHPPVQGKVALERLKLLILDRNFPESREEARKFLESPSSPLLNPKSSLIRNFLDLFLKEFLKLDNHTDRRSQRQIAAAINATREMHRMIVEEDFPNYLNKICGDQVVIKSNLDRVVKLLAWVPDSEQHLEDMIIVQLENYIRDVSNADIEMIGHALDVNNLREHAKEKLAQLDVDQLAILVERVPRKDYFPYAIELYKEVEFVDVANKIAREIIIPLSEFIDVKNATDLLKVITSNEAAEASPRRIDILQRIENSPLEPRIVDELFDEFNIQEDRPITTDIPYYYRNPSKSSGDEGKE